MLAERDKMDTTSSEQYIFMEIDAYMTFIPSSAVSN